MRTLAVGLNDRSAAEDCAQEAFAAAFRSWSRVSKFERPAAWVYVVALNRGKRHFARMSRDAGWADVHGANAESLDRVDNADSLQRALDLLGSRQRLCVVLRYRADLSIKEVAQAMRCSEGTVKSTLHTALRRLRVELVDTENREGS